jgi:crossover junction endodeoxyribonuclease RuvC
MLVIGIDPGTATTGYGLIREEQNGSLVLVDYGTINTKPDYPMHQRLLLLFEKLNELLVLHRPDAGSVEKLFFQTNVKTAIAVGQARGVALLSLASAGLPVSEFTPLEVKQAVVGYGNASKTQVQQMVRALLGMAEIPKPDDAADALAVAICHIHSAKMRSVLANHK